MKKNKLCITLKTLFKMLGRTWVIFIPPVLNVQKMYCKQIPVYIDVELSTQEVLWCKYGGMFFRAVGWNGLTLAIGSCLKPHMLELEMLIQEDFRIGFGLRGSLWWLGLG